MSTTPHPTRQQLLQAVARLERAENALEPIIPEANRGTSPIVRTVQRSLADIGHAKGAILAVATELLVPRTDEQVIADTNKLARRILGWGGFVVPEGHEFHTDPNPRAQAAWRQACELEELFNHTDPENAVANVVDEAEAAGRAEADHLATTGTPNQDD